MHVLKRFQAEKLVKTRRSVELTLKRRPNTKITQEIAEGEPAAKGGKGGNRMKRGGTRVLLQDGHLWYLSAIVLE